MKNSLSSTISGICLLIISLCAAAPTAHAADRILPIEKEQPPSSGIFELGGETTKKSLPVKEKVNSRKEEISDSSLLNKKAPMLTITEPAPGEAARAYQKFSGKVGGGIAKIFLRINDDTQVVSIRDGAFEAYGALKPGLNDVVALAWDLEGNLGKDAVKLILKDKPGGPAVNIKKPAVYSSVNITENRVITISAETDDKEATEGTLVINNMPRRVNLSKGVMHQDVALFAGLNEIYVEVDGKAGPGRSEPVRVVAFDARPKDLVAILTWDSPTADFDLHVWDSFGHHTFNEAQDEYMSGASIPGGSLDMDRKGSYGPEVFSLDDASPEVYTFAVKYNPGFKEKGARAYLRIILHGDDPNRRIIRSFGPVDMDNGRPVWEAAHVKMPEGVFFQEKDADLTKTFGMDVKAINRLALMLDEENSAFKLLAISAMGQIKSEKALPPLHKLLAHGTSDIRRAVAGALWDIKSLSSVDPLANALKDEDAQVRRTAAAALGYIGDPTAFPYLTGLLVEESDVMTRIEIIRALGQIGDQRAFDSIAAQAPDPDARIRVEALRALGSLKATAAEGLLIEALASDKEEDVRGTAAWALGKVGSQKSQRPLSDALRFDFSEAVRVRAALAMGDLLDKDAIPELQIAIDKDSSERVKKAAVRAMNMLNPVVERAHNALPPVELDSDVVIY